MPLQASVLYLTRTRQLNLTLKWSVNSSHQSYLCISLTDFQHPIFLGPEIQAFGEHSLNKECAGLKATAFRIGVSMLSISPRHSSEMQGNIIDSNLQMLTRTTICSDRTACNVGGHKSAVTFMSASWDWASPLHCCLRP